jgi:hypothetical protein
MLQEVGKEGGVEGAHVSLTGASGDEILAKSFSSPDHSHLTSHSASPTRQTTPSDQRSFDM